MSDWFSFWGSKETSDTKDLEATVDTTANIKKAIKSMQTAKSVIGAVENISSLANIPLYKKERDNAIKAIENQVLAGQDQIFKELAYNTDQAITYAARGNVSIGAPVVQERMKKGAEEAGFDFAMLRSNAEIQKQNAKISYAAKRRQTWDNAIKGIWNAALTYGIYGG